jgi:hypothetical protein
MCTKFWLDRLRGRDHLEGPGIDGRILLNWILGKDGGCRLDLCGSV